MMRGWRLALCLILAGTPLRAELTPVPLEMLLEAALTEAAGPGLPPGASLELMLPEGLPPEALRVISLREDLANGRFAAVIEPQRGAHLTLAGRFQAMVDVPVPLRSLAPGDMARAEDFTLRRLPLQALTATAVLGFEQIRGREVRRLLPEGRPVPAGSLREPRVIRRGDRLELLYTARGLRVTAAARALEDAALGATVRVQNLSSGKIVTGQALTDGRVEIDR
ncbi:flagellar basal body P-ring formation chaperone FlgA [Falsigemmobacter faecalis]|uniref:Flagella basal body P-ring formation protein FlgA n=1 Tax=Falsigemmobacter faecalis TaxID=2488730 RepID=A0A3P3DNN5_9RHOB|nr:flagellar basal body P-ring formation chaperone FlgA [Falsigemmobacter faecalis]RRH75785.1 flagellar basal body P-ring formation protein FlgA [Falsigemmobacter faecalis]